MRRVAPFILSMAALAPAWGIDHDEPPDAALLEFLAEWSDEDPALFETAPDERRPDEAPTSSRSDRRENPHD